MTHLLSELCECNRKTDHNSYVVMATSERIFVDQENQAPEGVLAPKRGKLRATEGTIQRAVLGEISQNVRQPPHQLRASKPAAQVGHMSVYMGDVFCS